MKPFLPILFLIIFSLNGCGKSDKILADQDFDSGDWLLVNINYIAETVEIIDDEAILKANPNGLWVTPLGECGGTTCDGFLILYKDGKLVVQHEYLSRDVLFESDQIKKAYKKGVQWTLDPIDESDFNMKWDSLKYIKNAYPTVYHSQPADKDIIWAYRIIE